MNRESVLAIDPGESTGWLFGKPWNKDDERILGQPYFHLVGGTAGKDHVEVAGIILSSRPDVVVLERFNLYPGKAKSMSWNSFYPCEVIGVVKYVCQLQCIPIVELAPSVKKYSGVTTKNHPTYLWMKEHFECTEHTYDALQLLEYYLRNKK